MYYQDPFTGDSLPPKTLCLTYDDGPGAAPGEGVGPHTLELAQYLNQEGIQATFFTVGKYAAQYQDVLSGVHACGHLVANHTYEHPELVNYLAAGGDLFDQVARADGHIRKWADGATIFFRPPYGGWSPDVAAALNANLAVCLNHVGPITWSIDGGDWACWQSGTSPEDCAQQYLSLIGRKQQGIVLMHDSSADRDFVQKRNMTLQLTRLIIPQLRSQGYQFVRLDSIPELKQAAQVPLRFALLASNGKYVSPQGGGGGRVLVNGPAVGPWEPLIAEDLGYGKIAIKASNGLYLSPQDGGGDREEVLANGPAVGEWEPLDLISVGPGRVAFRTIRGLFLTRESVDGGRLMTSAPWMREWEIFTFANLSSGGWAG